jgi:two-component system response regulator AtoC
MSYDVGHAIDESSDYNLLIIDDERGMCDSLKHLLSSRGFSVSTAESIRSGLRILQRSVVDLVVCDIVMPDMSGLVLLEKLKGSIPVIMMTAYASIETTRKAFKLGASDYLVKPFDFEELLVVVRQNLRPKTHIAKAQADACLDSHNPVFMRMLDLSEKFAKTDMPILITGESGTGKEVLAKHIHERSVRKGQSFLSLNCAAIPEALLESELFGYEKGAFTGATISKSGKFLDAENGTLFLDEIADMPLRLQAKILRFLEDFTYTPLGATKSIRIDTRIVAATNKDLQSSIAEGTFREDLFHRLNGLRLELPPLRERGEDLLLLLDHFLSRFAEKYGKAIQRAHTNTIEVLAHHDWPGNIREFRNCIERAVVMCDEEVLMPEDLPDSVLRPDIGAFLARHDEKVFTDLKDQYMRKVILEALAKTKGNKSEAAIQLHISRRTLYKRMKDLGITYVFE